MLLPGTSSAAEWRDLLQSRRQFWPTLTTPHASLVPVSAEALQRERRQMQAKHLWYNVDIRWSDLKDKLEVLAPTLHDDNAAASCSDVKPRWRSWDGDYAMGYQRHP